jgi:hypothetical protein
MMSDSDTPIDPQQFSDEFSALCFARHEVGAEEYGDMAFMDNDMFAFVYEELADAANYLRYQFMKLRIVEETLRARGIDPASGFPTDLGQGDQVPSGPSSFSTSEEVSAFLPLQEK